VTLRSDIHAAVDEVVQPAPGLERDVLEFARTAGRRRGESGFRSGGRWSLRVRRGGALAAAMLVVALMATLVIGGRVWRDWSGSSTNPSSAAGQALATLHARPMHVPLLPPGADCPDGPYTNVVYGSAGPPLALGVGPAYVYVGSRTPTSWGTYFNLEIFIDPHVAGPVLVRGQDLETAASVVFDGPSASGKHGYRDVLTTTDPQTGDSTVVTIDQRPELVLNPADQDTSDPANEPFRVWWNWLGVAGNASMCIALQIDGPRFSEVVVARK